MKISRALILLAIAWSFGTQAQLIPGDNDLYVRIVDVGPGLCTITRVPGPHFMVYDAGHWTNRNCRDAALEIIGDHDIDLMVISHNDGDHMGDADEILQNFMVNKIIRTGFKRHGVATWDNMNEEIAHETRHGATVINLGTEPLPPGTPLHLGTVPVQVVRGYNKWPFDEGSLSGAELRNVISIVLRLTYKDRSILYTGDTVGRDMHIDSDDQCKYAEGLMVDNAGEVPVDADIIIAPHHGSETSGSTCFLNAVGAEFAIFSAGHRHVHPRIGAVERYITTGVDESKVFRTDRGDDEGPEESPLQRVSNCKDSIGDDDVEIVIRQNGNVEVDYREAPMSCVN